MAIKKYKSSNTLRTQPISRQRRVLATLNTLIIMMKPHMLLFRRRIQKMRQMTQELKSM